MANFAEGDVRVQGFVIASSIALAAITAAVFLAVYEAFTVGASLPGDVDCNGRINSVDAVLILQRNAGLISSLPCNNKADVNNDGRVDSLDAALVLQFTARIIDRFPRCDVTVGPAGVQAAIEQASTGTTICLREGTYSRVHVIRKTGVTIIGAGPRTIVTDSSGSSGCVFVFESQDIVVEGVLARNCVERGAFAASSTNVTFSRLETRGGPVGIQFTRSTGNIRNSDLHGHRRSDPPGFGALTNEGSTVTIQNSQLRSSDIGLLARDNSTLVVRSSTVADNSGVGINTMTARSASQRGGRTTIEQGTRVTGNNIGIFAGVPGCAPLPAADPNPPVCYLQAPSDFVSSITIRVTDSNVNGNRGTGVVIFPGVHATLRDNTIRGNGLTGLFAWGARVDANGNDYDRNVENGIECRAYPDPSTGDRGRCTLIDENIRNSQPLPGNRLGGGFVSEGGLFYLRESLVENNWGVGVSVHHRGKGEVTDTRIRNNGGSAYCISDAGWITMSRNQLSGNRPGTCMPHP